MLEKKITVASFDVYPNSTLKPSALQKYMQQLAREDCDAMGCTYIDMRNVNMVFVMTKMGININCPVFAYDELTVRTYNNRISGVTFEREFEFYRKGEEVIHATTQWVIVNFDDRKIVRPRMFPFEIPAHNIDCASVEIPRAIVIPEESARVGQRTVVLSDLDENDHLNNCVYSDIAMDVVADYDRVNDFVKSVKIIYRHEARINEILSLSVGKSAANDGNYTISAFNESNQMACFEAEIGLGKING